MQKLFCLIFYFTIGLAVYSPQSIFAAQDICQSSLIVKPFDPYPNLNVNQYINLLLNQKSQFSHLFGKALGGEDIDIIIDTIREQISLARLLRDSTDMHQVLVDRSNLLTFNILVLSENQMTTQKTLNLGFLQNWGSQLAQSLTRLQQDVRDEELSTSILRAIQEILQKPYRALSPYYFISQLTNMLEDQDIRRAIFHEFQTTGKITLLEKYLPHQLEGLKVSQLMLEDKREKDDYIIALRDIIDSHEKLNDLIVLYIFSRVFHGRENFESYLVHMDESKLDALHDHHSQRKYIQEIIDFFPKEVRSFLYKTLMKRLQKLIKDIYKNAETIQSVSMAQHLKLIEVHPCLGIFRGYVGSDCSLRKAFGFPNDLNYRVFFIINERGEDVGYVSGTKVFLPNGTTAFFINTINGLGVSGVTTEIIFSVFSKVRKKLDVEEIVILGPQNEKTNLNYKSIKEIYRQYRGKSVRISFEDRSRRLREIIASQTKSKDEDPKLFKRANYLNEPHIDIHVDVEERPFGISIPEKEISKKGQLWVTLKNEELAHQLQFSLDVSEIIGNLSLHQFARNIEKMPITVYREKIEELFKAVSIEEGEKIDFENLFFEGMLKAPGAFHKEHIEKTREILRRFKRVRQFNGSEFLLWTMTRGYLEAAKLLIETMDVNAISASSAVFVSLHWRNYTALAFAIEKGYIEIAKLLIDKGADIDIQNKEGHTALMLASIEGHIEIVELLIDKGADIDIQNKEGDTALMLVSIEGHTEMVELFIDKGADIDIQNEEDCTALMLANREDHTEIVILFTDKGVESLCTIF